MPNLSRLALGGGYASLVPSFPAVTCPVQANMTTGKLPREHGVVANGFYWRDQRRVEMWTAWNDCIQRPQIWDILHDRDRAITSAVWFPLHSQGCGADYICTPAPVHNPDGSESLWCYTRPEMIYAELEPKLGHFPLQHFWGPLAGIQSTAWIVDSAIHTAEKYRPNFFYIYLPHLDYAAQKAGPDSPAAKTALNELDAEIGKLIAGFEKAYREAPLWLVASEYAIVPVEDVVYPNRLLREAGLLKVIETATAKPRLRREPGFALADHQHSHVFVQDSDPKTIKKVANLFTKQPGIAEVLTGEALAKYGLDHPAAATSCSSPTPDSWQAYYWWEDDKPSAEIRPHRRHPPQARLRPGRALLRHENQEHPARREPRERLARCPRHDARPTRRAAFLRSRHLPGPDGHRHRSRRHHPAAVRHSVTINCPLYLKPMA